MEGVIGVGTRSVHPHTKWFQVRGFRNGSVVAVTWSNGAVDGDPPTVDLIAMEVELVLAARADPHFAGSLALEGDTDGPILADPALALRIIERVIDTVTEVIASDEAG